MRTAADVTEKMGEPDYRLRFNHDDPADKSVYINRMPLASWKELEVATPTGLLDTLPIGTKLFSYTFVMYVLFTITVLDTLTFLT